MTYYRTEKYGYTISPVPVTAATDKTVTLAEHKVDNWTERARRVAIVSEYHRYWKTEEEAKEWLLQGARRRIDSARHEIADAEKAISMLTNAASRAPLPSQE